MTKPVRLYRVENGVIRFKVTPDDTTGPGWFKRLEQAGYDVGKYAKQLLFSSDFKPTNGGATEIAVITGSLSSNNVGIIGNIHAEAASRKYVSANPEVACLIRIMFSDEEIEDMGLSGIVVVHKPIKDVAGCLSLFCVNRGDKGRLLGTCDYRPSGGWYGACGLAFEVTTND